MAARICICDDDPVITGVLSRHLSAAGFAVQEPLSSVDQALGWLRIDPPDVLLLDLNMPAGGGGLDLLDWMRSEGLLDRVQVLMLTGEDDLWFIDRARRLGARGYLTKPVDGGGLVAKVRRLLDDRRVAWIDDYTILTLPAGAAPTASTTAAAPPPRGRHRILSVEDVACNQQLMRLFLEGPEYAVDQAFTGAEALAALAARRYDLVLMDLRLPDMDGLEVVRRLRSCEPPGVRTIVLAVSADALPQHVAQARLAGVDGHLAKPFTSASLRAAVDARLASRADRLERLNPVVAELAQAYGGDTVAKLLQSLLDQLGRMDVAARGGADPADTAHAIKGAASSLGFESISDACGELEAACRTGRVIEPPLRRAAEVCARVGGEIADCLNLAA